MAMPASPTSTKSGHPRTSRRPALILRTTASLRWPPPFGQSSAQTFTVAMKPADPPIHSYRILLCCPFLGDGNGQTNLASMSVDALLKLRGDIEKTLTRKAAQLKAQLSRLGDEVGYKRGRGSPLKGQRVAIKYRDKSGNTWAGRGAQPIWLREK